VAKQNGNGWIADQRMVKTGMDYDGIMEILEGLSVGEKIITAGFQNLNAGEKIVF
jgi:multidrug efflux pump subunit AcrA (membrane-fusion protein)